MLTKRTRDDEEEFDKCFDERGQLRDGVTRLRVPIRMITIPLATCHKTKASRSRTPSPNTFRARQRRTAAGFTPTASLRTGLVQWNVR